MKNAQTEMSAPLNVPDPLGKVDQTFLSGQDSVVSQQAAPGGKGKEERHKKTQGESGTSLWGEFSNLEVLSHSRRYSISNFGLSELMINQHAQYSLWKILQAGLLLGRKISLLSAGCMMLSLCFHGTVRAEEDTLANVWTGNAEEIRQQILKTAELPGGEAVRKLAEEPVLLWVNRCFFGTDNALSSEETRYAVIRLIVANRGTEELQLKKDKISLQAGGKTFSIGPKLGMLRNMPLQIDWHHNGNVRPQSQLRTPRIIKIAPGNAAAFWCLFSGFDPMPAIPQIKLTVEPESGEHLHLELTAQQNARLGLTTERMGPRNALAVLTIHGQLNRINSAFLAQQMTTTVDRGTSRFLIQWTPQAKPSDDVLFNWLLAAGRSTGEANPLQLQLPPLPAIRQILLAEVPKDNADVEEWGDVTDTSIYEQSRDAAVLLLKDVYERVDPRVALQEIQTGHPWSRIAAMEIGGGRLQPDALPTLLKLSRDPDPELQQAAILALGVQSQPEAQARLLELVVGSDQAVSEIAFKGLLQAATPAHRAAVKQLFEQQRLKLPRSHVLKLLAENYHPDWEDEIVQGVLDKDVEVRCQALTILHQIGHPQLNKFCIAALSDQDEAVREQAFQILIDGTDRTAEQAASAYALQRLQEGHIDESILEFVERTRETKAAPALIAALKKPDTVRFRLVEVIAEIGTSDHLQQVIEMADEFNDEETLAALQLVSHLSMTTQLKFIKKVLATENASVVYPAIELLKTIGNEEALDILESMLKNNDSANHVDLICMALGEIGTPGAIRRLREFREQSGKSGNVAHLNAAMQGLKRWRTRLPGFNFIEAGYVHVASDEDDEAIKAFSMAILINPDLSDAYSSRGNVYLRKNQFKQAGEDFEHAMELDGFDGQAITGCAIVRAIDGEWESAVQLIEKTTSHFPRDRFFIYNSACVYSRCVEALKKKDPGPERDKQIARFEQLSLDKLKEALEGGFSDTDWMQRDPDLAAIRGLPGFKKLLTND